MDGGATAPSVMLVFLQEEPRGVFVLANSSAKLADAMTTIYSTTGEETKRSQQLRRTLAVHGILLTLIRMILFAMPQLAHRSSRVPPSG